MQGLGWARGVSLCRWSAGESADTKPAVLVGLPLGWPAMSPADIPVRESLTGVAEPTTAAAWPRQRRQLLLPWLQPPPLLQTLQSLVHAPAVLVLVLVHARVQASVRVVVALAAAVLLLWWLLPSPLLQPLRTGAIS